MPARLGATLTIGEVVQREHVAVLGQEGQRHVRGALADHEVDGDEALEHDGPRGIAQPVLQGAKDLADAGIARVRGDENVLNVLCLGRRILGAGQVSERAGAGAAPEGARPPSIVSHLDLGGALDGLFEGARHGAGAARVGCAVVSGELEARTQMAG